ncbi:Exonuclease SbcC [Desulfovibrio sp. DV]|nr:Exonuclease SbcC [Desulfovibrio sp. DV]
MPQVEGHRQPHKPDGTAGDEHGVKRRPGPGHGPDEYKAGHGKGNGRHVISQIRNGFGCNRRVRGQEGRGLGQKRPQSQPHERDGHHPGHGDAVADAPGVVGPAGPDQVADQYRGREIEGHGRQKQDRFQAHAGRHAGQGGHASGRQGAGDGKQHQIAGVPHDLHQARRPGDLEQIGTGATHPAPARELAALKHPQPQQGREVEKHPGRDRGKGAPGHAGIAEIRPPERPQAEPEIAHGIEHGRQPPGEKRHHDQPARPKKRIGNDEKRLDGQQKQQHGEKIPGRRQNRLRHLEQAQEQVAGEHPADQNDQRGGHAGQQAQPDIAVGPGKAARALGLAHSGHGPIGHGSGQHLEKKHGLGQDADRRLRLPINASADIHVHETDEKRQKHHEDLRPGQGPDFAETHPGGQQSVLFLHQSSTTRNKASAAIRDAGTGVNSPLAFAARKG